MSQKIKAPNSKGGNGFLWVIVAILAIAAVVIGLFVYKNNGSDKLAEEMPQQDVNFTVSREDNSVVLASKDVKDDAPTVEIFEDFSCPHCADLVKADKEDSYKALNEGKVKIRFNFLNFLDDGNPGSSTRGAAVALALADTGNAKAFWNAHNYYMENQATVARSWEYEDFANSVKGYGLEDSVVESIKNGEVQDKALDVTKANADDLTKRIGSVSSPVVFVDGKQFQIKMGEDRKPVFWVPEVVK